MKSNKKILHNIQILLWGTLFFLCVCLEAYIVAHAQSTFRPVGIFLSVPGKYEILGAIKAPEWRWYTKERVWWGNLVTIKVSGAQNKTWKKFGLANSGRQYEVSERTRESPTYPVRIFVQGYSNSQRPGDLILKKRVSVSEDQARFFEFDAADFFLAGKPLTQISFALSRLPLQKVYVPAVLLNPEKKAAEPTDLAMSDLPKGQRGVPKGNKSDLTGINDHISELKGRLEVLRRQINSDRTNNRNIVEIDYLNQITKRVLKLKIQLDLLENRLSQTSNDSEKIDPKAFDLQIGKLEKNLQLLEAQLENYPENINRKTTSRKPSDQKKVKKPPLLLLAPEKLKPFQEKMKPYLQPWAAELAAVPAEALSYVLTVFVVALLGAIAGMLYQNKQLKIFDEDPVLMKWLDPDTLKASEKSAQFLKNSILSFTLILLSSVYLSSQLQGALANKKSIYSLIVCFIIFFVAGKRLKWVSSFFYCTVVLLVNLILFGVGDLLPEASFISNASFVEQTQKSLAAIVGLGISICTIWWMATKNPKTKNRLAHINAISLALVMIFFFGSIRNSVLLLPAMLVLSLLWFLIFRFYQKRRMLPKALYWLGLAYIRLKKCEDLEKTVEKLETLKKADPLEIAWLKANLFDQKGNTSDAIRMLEDLPPSLRCDQLLLQLYARTDNYSAIEKRVALHKRDDAATLLKNLPRTDKRDVTILNLLARENAWEEFSEFLGEVKKNQAISVLEQLPSSPERDDQLILLLFHAGQLDKIVKVIESYSASEGAAKLRALLPAGAVCDRLVVQFFAQRGDYDQLRRLLIKIPTDTAVSILLSMPPRLERDQLLAELWVNAGELETLLNYLSDLETTYGIKILTQLNPGIVRDRALASIYSQTNQHQKVVDCLEDHFGQGQLPAADLRLLSQSYSNLDKHQESILALEAAWTIEPADEELFKELCRKSIDAGQPSALLAKLEHDTLIRLSADSLWILVEYNQQYNQVDNAKRAAEISIKIHKDHRAVFYLGRLLEETGDFQKAAEIYAVAGKEGYFNQAMCLFQLQDYAGASELLKNARKTDDNRSTLLYHLGHSLVKTGKLEDALAAFEEMDEIQHDEALQKDAVVLCGLIGASKIAKQNYEDAIRFLEKGLRYAPPEAAGEVAQIKEALGACYFNLALAEIHHDKSGTEAALGFLEKAKDYRSSGSWSELDFLRGISLLNNSEIERALHTFTVLSKRSPKNAQYLFHKALSAAIAGKEAYAETVFNQLLILEESEAYKHRTTLILGILELNRGNLKAAEEHFRSAIDLG